MIPMVPMAHLVRSWSRAGAWLVAAILLLVPPAFAQAPPASPPAATPILLAMDLGKVAVGSWAQYRASDGAGNALSIKLVLVGRTGKVAELETVVEGGPLAALGRTSVRTSIFTDTGADAKPDEHVLQVGGAAPMLIPAAMSGAQAQSFRPVDAKEKVGVEAVEVPAGRFPEAAHFRSKKNNGDVVDTWVSRDVPPFGLLKIRTGSASAGAQALQLELVAHGMDARRTITANPGAFDPAALMKLIQPLAPRQTTSPSGAGASSSGAASRSSAVVPSKP